MRLARGRWRHLAPPATPAPPRAAAPATAAARLICGRTTYTGGETSFSRKLVAGRVRSVGPGGLTAARYAGAGGRGRIRDLLVANWAMRYERAPVCDQKSRGRGAQQEAQVMPWLGRFFMSVLPF